MPGPFPRGIKDSQGRDLSRFPDAAWCAEETLTDHPKWRFAEGSILVGSLGDQVLGIQDDRHMMTVAGSRAGKGRSVIIPNMLTYPGSIIAIDPKGDLASITASRRGTGSPSAQGLRQDVFVLDPFMIVQGPAERYRAGFNPLDAIDHEGIYARDDAALLADSLIIPGRTESYWTDAAKMLLTGMILHVCASETGDRRNLLTLREKLTGDLDAFSLTLAEMAISEVAEGVVARAANTLVAMSDRERSSILSTAIVQTDFLDSAAMHSVLSKSNFTLGALKDKPVTVFLSLPAGRIGTHSRWLRLMIALTLEAMERHRQRPTHPVLVIMDEFHALGPMQVIERAAGLIAGFGVRLWPILQDLTQLKRDYADSWETFLGNAGLTQWFGLNDLTTLEYLSKRLGQTTINVISQGEISQGQKLQGFSGQSLSKQMIELMSAEELSRYFSRQSGRQLVLWPGSDPIACDRITYDTHDLFKGKFDPDTNYPLKPNI